MKGGKERERRPPKASRGCRGHQITVEANFKSGRELRHFAFLPIETGALAPASYFFGFLTSEVSNSFFYFQ